MSSAPMLGSLQISASSDSAQSTVEVRREPKRRLRDRQTEMLFRCIAAAYRSYHPAYDSRWVQDREGVRRLRLVGRFGTEAAPNRRYVSIDLEDFQ
jgi:hypothetical protein